MNYDDKQRKTRNCSLRKYLRETQQKLQFSEAIWKQTQPFFITATMLVGIKGSLMQSKKTTRNFWSQVQQ